MSRFIRYLGLAGVAKDESPTAIQISKYFNIVLMFAIVWLVFEVHLEMRNKIDVAEAWLANFFVWAFFVLETTVLTLLVNNKQRYLKGNWMNLAIILAGTPLLFMDMGPFVTLLRVLRIILLFGLLSPWIVMSVRFLTDNRLDTTIFAAVLILIMAGMIISAIDPGINSVEEGIWWAWVTISTVGYGDIVPQTTMGRIFSGFLILLGMGLFSVITANFAAILVQKNQKQARKQMDHRMDETMESIHDVEEREEVILNHLTNIAERLELIEKKLEQNRVIDVPSVYPHESNRPIPRNR